MAEFSTPPCPDNWEHCDFCGAGPNDGCMNPDYEKKGKRVSANTCTTHCGKRQCGPMGCSTLRGKSPASTPTGGKAVNLKDIAARHKVSMSLVPEIANIELAQAFRDGAKKYTPFNWRDTPVNLSVYTDAIYRHLALFNAGQDRASDSGLHHLTHIMSGCAIVLDAILNDTLIDDRHPMVDPSVLEEMLEEYRAVNAGEGSFKAA